SPDGRRVAVFRTVEGNADIWVMDDVRFTRFTSDPGPDRWPLWSPDGVSIVFDSLRQGHRDLFQKAANGAGSERVLLESPQDKAIYDWSRDGRFLLYGFRDSKSSYDAWVSSTQGERRQFAFLNGPFEERQPRFSPDSRWVAYASNESGR